MHCSSSPRTATTVANISVALRILKDSVATVCRSISKRKVGTHQSDMVLHCQDPLIEPIKFILKPDSMYHVNEHDQLVLPCVAFGHPQPTIKWLKVRSKVSSLVLFLFISNVQNTIQLPDSNDNLTLARIEKTDHGLYVCQAFNEHTTTNISTLVLVQSESKSDMRDS